MASERPHPAYLWLNGEMIRWEDATVHASLLGWSTMAAVFEGIKAYWNPEEGQLYAYQFREHYQRFARSMKMQRMNSPWSPDQLIEASLALVRANGAREDTYISPLAYFGDSTFYGTQTDSSTHIRIIARPFQSGLGSGKTITACVSSWTRISENTLSPRIKAIANYQNSRTAAIEAKQNGYDQPILLNAQGKVTEGAAACLFFIRDGVVITQIGRASCRERV